ncbi:MAG TPA: hypothetical protein VHD32_08390 [Candidatus Didemnitutus sp.]|nr:hypothetical protein [Candidatus Didemnitutus sp.]
MTIPWSKVHGASTHFPIVLTLVAFACDGLAVARWTHPEAHGLRLAGLIGIMLAGFGCVAAVVSGLYLTHGELWGTGALGWHHRFVWPAFALIIGAAAWRWTARPTLTRTQLGGYALVVFAGSLLIFAAAYFGGELVSAQP